MQNTNLLAIPPKARAVIYYSLAALGVLLTAATSVVGTDNPWVQAGKTAVEGLMSIFLGVAGAYVVKQSNDSPSPAPVVVEPVPSVPVTPETPHL